MNKTQSYNPYFRDLPKDPISSVKRMETRFEAALAGSLRNWIEVDGSNAKIVACHYRGLQVLSQKKTSVFCKFLPDSFKYTDSERLNEFNEFVLRCYENLQNMSQYTMNAVLGEYAEFNEIQCPFIFRSNRVNNGNCKAEINDSKNITLSLTKGISKLLLGDSELPKLALILNTKQILESNILQKISEYRTNLICLNNLFKQSKQNSEDINDLSEDSLCGNLQMIEHEIDALVRKAVNDNQAVEKIKYELYTKRKITAYAIAGGEKSKHINSLRMICDVLKPLFYDNTKYNETISSVDKMDRIDNQAKDLERIIRMLQGICAYHEFGQYMTALVFPTEISTDIPDSKRYFITTVTWVGDFETNNGLIPQNPINDLNKLFSGAVEGFNNILGVSRNPNDKKENTIDKVIFDEISCKKVKTSLTGTIISDIHLSAVLKLAESFRPDAVHEGNPIELVFCLGTQHHLSKYFRGIKPLSQKNDFQHDLKLGLARFAWLPLCEKRAAEIYYKKPFGSITNDQNNDIPNLFADYLNICKARIKGNHGFLSGSDKILFVDYLVDWPEITHTARISKKLEDQGVTLREFTALDPDMCLVRVCGRSRVELLHKGKVIIAWSDGRASWVIPPQWTSDTLSSYFNNAFQNTNSKIEEYFKQIAELCVYLSDTPGCGAAIILSDNEIKEMYCSDMTDPLQKYTRDELGESLKNKLLFRELAIQDGATVITLKRSESGIDIKARQQLLPFTKGKPWCYRNAIIDENGDKLSDAWPVKGTPLFWREWYDVLHWGTRHLSSLGISACLRGQKSEQNETLPNVVSICISADGPIHVFEHGTCIIPEELELETGRFDSMWRERTREFL